MNEIKTREEKNPEDKNPDTCTPSIIDNIRNVNLYIFQSSNGFRNDYYCLTRYELENRGDSYGYVLLFPGIAIPGSLRDHILNQPTTTFNLLLNPGETSRYHAIADDYVNRVYTVQPLSRQMLMNVFSGAVSTLPLGENAVPRNSSYFDPPRGSVFRGVRSPPRSPIRQPVFQRAPVLAPESPPRFRGRIGDQIRDRDIPRRPVRTPSPPPHPDDPESDIDDENEMEMEFPPQQPFDDGVLIEEAVNEDIDMASDTDSDEDSNSNSDRDSVMSYDY